MQNSDVRVGGENHKGVLSRNRTPKSSAKYVAGRYAALADSQPKCPLSAALLEEIGCSKQTPTSTLKQFLQIFAQESNPTVKTVVKESIVKLANFAKEESNDLSFLSMDEMTMFNSILQDNE